jgi:hypothetical protein
MKKLIVVALLSLAAACGGGKKASSTPTNKTDGAKTAPDPKMQGAGDKKAEPKTGETEEDPCAAPH